MKENEIIMKKESKNKIFVLFLIKWLNEKKTKNAASALSEFDLSPVTKIANKNKKFLDINRAIESATDNRFGLRPALGDKKPYGTSWKYKAGILGPSASQISNIADIMWDTGTGEYNHHTARNVRRLIPFQNVFYLDWIFDKVEKGLRF